MIENLPWFVAGWCSATLVLTAYLLWMRRDGEEQSTERKLRQAQRDLKAAQEAYQECNSERLRAVADHNNEMQYRNRDRRQLADAIELLNTVREYCATAGASTSGDAVLDIIEGRVRD